MSERELLFGTFDRKKQKTKRFQQETKYFDREKLSEEEKERKEARSRKPRLKALHC